MAQFSTDKSGLLNNNNTLYEVVMVAGQAGPSIYVSSGNLNTSSDAFGRTRVSQPYTLFDSSHRFSDNGLWATAIVSGGSVAHSPNEGLVNLIVDTTANAEVVRETLKVFSYQPGKSLLIMNSVVFAPAKTNLRQRTGYYGARNGIFIELDNDTLSIVKRSYNNGSPVDTKIVQDNWNVDRLDGTGPSGLQIDISKSQIMFTDIEWLGMGSVRTGFIINGQYIICHIFHHANDIASTYMTTASLPLRYEIKNTGVTDSSSTMKQVCSTVISEGGYELHGTQQSVGTPITSAYAMATGGTFYPVVSLRLKSTPINRLDAIAIISAGSVMGVGNNVNYRWEIRANTTVTGGTWTSAGANSAVEYNLDGTAVSGGRILAAGFTNSSNQGSPTVALLKEALFRFQLERDALAGTPYVISLCVAAASGTQSIFGSLDWEEITR